MYWWRMIISKIDCCLPHSIDLYPWSIWYRHVLSQISVDVQVRFSELNKQPLLGTNTSFLSSQSSILFVLVDRKISSNVDTSRMTISPPKSLSDLSPELLLKITDHLFDHYFDCQLWPLYPYGAYTPPNTQESRMRRTTLRNHGIKHFSAIGDIIEVLRPFIHDQLGRLPVKAVDFSGSRISYMPDARTRTAWQQLKHIEVP